MTTTEKYFRALGWEEIKGGWRSLGSETELTWSVTSLPNITQSYPDFKKWVLEKMAGEGFYYEFDGLHGCVEWRKEPFDEPVFEELIENKEILEAAVIAATRYWEEKK